MQALTEEIIRLVMKQDPTLAPEDRDELLTVLFAARKRGCDAPPDKPPPTSLRLYRIGQAAEVLGLSRCTVWRCVKEGRIGTVEIRRGAMRIPEAELQRFVAGRA